MRPPARSARPALTLMAVLAVVVGLAAGPSTAAPPAPEAALTAAPLAEASSATSLQAETTTAVVRLSGPDRVRTAVALSQSRFATGTPVAFVTTPSDFPDALAAGPAAGFEAAPILLAGQTLPQATADELARLDPRLIIVVGGPAAVSNAVRDEIIARHPQALVRPLVGSSRFDTAVQVSRATFRPGADVWVATGSTFPDALAGGPAAGAAPGPVLLVEGNRIPPVVREEIERLRPPVITVLGGTSAISEDVQRQLAGIVGSQVVRRSGPTRFATAAAVADASFPGVQDTVYVASGATFPDALAGVPLAVLARGPLLLVEPDRIPAPTDQALRRMTPRRIVVIGGTAAVSAQVEQQLQAYLRS
jgi:putative cell wall-binding protein